MNKFICQREIDQSITINTLIKELLTSVKIGISVMVIYHRGYTIETIAIKVELVKPILHIRQQEVLDLALAVVENLRVPIWLIASIALLRVVVWRAVEFVYALVKVLDIVGVNDIHNYGNTHFVGLAYQRLQLFGCAEAR